MPTALKLVHSASDATLIRPPANDAGVAPRRRLKVTYVKAAKPAAPCRSRGRRMLVHVEKLSECVAVGVVTQVVVLALKSYGILS